MRKTIILDSGWVAAQVGNVQSTGFELTTTHPPMRESPKLPWMEGAVPGTILGTLLKNKLIPDPFYGLENNSIIDIADAGREYYTYWFFTAFNLSKDESGAHVWLQFRGINYQADVFLNGHTKSLPKGMFQRHLMDITEWVSFEKANLLAVLVHPPDHPGRIPPEGGQGGDHAIGQDVATQYVEGWDWMCPIRDRNTGIWDEVSIFLTGPVRISDPHLVGSFFDDFKRVYLHTSVELQNATPKSQVCVVRLQVGYELEGDILSIEHVQEQEVSVPGGTTIMYTFPALFFYKPLLWWPNGMGKQNLYKVEIDVEVRGYGDSDSWTHHFGFRKIESHIDPSTGGRLFKVNGEPMFVRGGNWIVSDGLLRLSEERYKSDIDFHADMNFNMVRCWAGGITERPSFYENCDRRGVLVWEEFWITGDNDGRSLPDHPSNPNWPLDHELFLTCARDTIKLLRNHPSLALWVGGNEQHPAEDLNTALQEYLKMHPFYDTPDSVPITELPWELPQGYVDPSRYLDGTRIYIEGSLWGGFAKGNGEFTDGPYNIQYPESFFKDDFYPYGFNPELGSIGTPVAATIRATMPPEAWEPPKMVLQPNGYILEVPNATWTYHTYIPYSDPEKKVHDQIELYGKPKDLDDFCNKAQIVNYIQYRALMEGWSSHMWTKYTGGLIWKNQNPWTGLRGQFYDHLHDQTGSFFGVRLACEPIHVQLNLYDMFVEVVNTTASPLENVSIEATVWDLNGLSPYHQTSRQTIPQKKMVKVFEMRYPKSKDAKPVYFLVLKLTESNGSSLLSRNLYWLFLPGGSFKLLGGDFKTLKIPLRTLTRSFLTGTTCKMNVQITNISKTGYTYNNDRITPVEESEGKKPLASFIRGFTELVLLPKKKLFSPCPPNETEIISASSSSGVAFWLHLSVHLEGKSLRPGNDTRILPVTYSDNYFSLVPGETMDVEISFQLPESGTPKLVLEGWNTEEHHVSFHPISVGGEGSATGI